MAGRTQQSSLGGCRRTPRTARSSTRCAPRSRFTWYLGEVYIASRRGLHSISARFSEDGGHTSQVAGIWRCTSAAGAARAMDARSSLFEGESHTYLSCVEIAMYKVSRRVLLRAAGTILI